MELGLNFEDAFYEDNKRKVKTPPTCYNAKYCSLLWFEKAEAADDEERLQHLKFSADYHFAEGHYEHAIHQYQAAIELLPEHNSSMYQDMRESVSRAHLRLGRLETALHIANSLYDQAVIPSHCTRHLYLLHNIYTAVADYRENQKVLQKLLLMHPANVHFWWSLTDCYSQRLEGTAARDGQQHHESVTAASNSDHHHHHHLHNTSQEDVTPSKDDHHHHHHHHHNTPQQDVTLSTDDHHHHHHHHHNTPQQDVTSSKDDHHHQHHHHHNTPQQDVTSSTDDHHHHHHHHHHQHQHQHHPLLSPQPAVTRLQYLTCLYRCCSLLNQSLKTTSSFVNRQHTGLYSKVQAAIEQFPVEESILAAIKQVVNQDLGYNSDVTCDKLTHHQENTQRFSTEDFESRWFSWIDTIHPYR